MFSFSRDDRQRDVFPLPLIKAPFPEVCGHDSRSAKRRRNRKQHSVDIANSVISALNPLYGCKPTESVELSGCQREAQSHILRRSAGFVAPEVEMQKSPEEAYSALLGSSAVYGDGGPLKSYVKGLVSLPDDVTGSPFVTSILGADDQEIWQDFVSRVMLSNEEYEEVLLEEDEAGLYMDPKLSKNKKEYGGFLKDMHKRGMI